MIRDTVDFDSKQEYYSSKNKIIDNNKSVSSDGEGTSNEDKLNDQIEEVEELSNENSISPQNPRTKKSCSNVTKFLKTTQSSTPLNVKLKLQVT